MWETSCDHAGMVFERIRCVLGALKSRKRERLKSKYKNCEIAIIPRAFKESMTARQVTTSGKFGKWEMRLGNG